MSLYQGLYTVMDLTEQFFLLRYHLDQGDDCGHMFIRFEVLGEAALKCCSETVLVDGDLYTFRNWFLELFRKVFPDEINHRILGFMYAFDEKQLHLYNYMMWFRDWHVPCIYIGFVLYYSTFPYEYRIRLYYFIESNGLPYYYQFKNAWKKYRIQYNDTTALVYLDENRVTTTRANYILTSYNDMSAAYDAILQYQ
jgi:hypothetical protein